MARFGTTSKQLSGTLFWNFTGLFLSLVAGVITARLLLPDGKGILALVLTAVSLTSLTSALGSNVAVRIYLPRSEVQLNSYRHVSQLLSLLSVVAILAVVFALGFFVEARLFQIWYLLSIVWLGLATFMSNQVFDAFNAMGKNSLSAFLSAFGTFCVLISLLVMILLGASLLSALVAYAFGTSLRVIVALVMLRGTGFYAVKPRHVEARMLLHKGFPLLGLNLGQTVTFRLDQFVLGGARGAYEVGLYSVASTPASVSQVISNSIGQVVFRKTAVGDFRKRQIFLAAGAATAITAVFSITLFGLAPWLIPFLFGDAYRGAVPILRLLLIAETCLAPYMVLSRAAAGAKLIGVASWSGVLGLVTMLSALLIFVPWLGAEGAAVANIIAYFIMTAFVSISVIRSRKI